MYNYLYTIFMQNLLSLFSSKAKVDVLRVLVRQTQPIALRHIAALSTSPLFSIQRALAALVDEHVLTRQESGTYVLFGMNSQHPFYPYLTQIFDLEAGCQIAQTAHQYDTKARQSLDFSRAARKLFKGVRHGS